MQFSDNLVSASAQAPVAYKKRKTIGKQPPGQTKALTPAKSQNKPISSPESVSKRPDDLEEVVYKHHDVQLRQLDSWSTYGWLMEATDPIAVALVAKMSEWNQTRPRKGPHPWGPPRRSLASELCKQLNLILPADSAFLKFHADMKDPSELETHSMNYMLVRKAFEGQILLKLRPVMQAMPIWMDAVRALNQHIVENKGIPLFRAPPPGKVVKKYFMKNLTNQEVEDPLL